MSTMKDKRTYTKLKEHGEDMSLENEVKITIDPNYKEDRGPNDLSFHIEKLQARIKQLEETLSSAQDINDAHQKYNGKLQTRLTEVEEDNKKLSAQISDYIKKHEDFIRRTGI